MNTSAQATVKAFFDPQTWTYTYVVYEKVGSPCIIIDSVLNYDPKSGRTKTRSADEVIAFVKNSSGLTYAEQKMVQFQQEALQILNDFPSSDYKDALTLMVNYVIERKK